MRASLHEAVWNPVLPVVPAQAGARLDCSRAIGSHPAERPRAVRDGRGSKREDVAAGVKEVTG
jgi:hypothetical protein